MAKKIDFKNEKQFRTFIENVSETSNDSRLSKIYNFLANFAKKHPKSIAKAAIAGGTITTMIVYLKNYQRQRTGCFRYIAGQMETEPKRIHGNFCINRDEKSEYNDDIMIPESEHPLYKVNKWDCDLPKNIFSNSLDPQTNHILSLGCSGLCDWQNFNKLADNMPKNNAYPYQPIDYNEHENIQGYVYKCEHITILRALASNVGTVVHETFSGIMDSNIGKKMTRVISLFLMIFLITLFYSTVISLTSNNKKEETERKKEET